MPVTTALADPEPPPHGTTGHLYDGCWHPDCVALRKWLAGRPLTNVGKRRLTGMSAAERMAWHRDKPAATRRGRPSGFDAGESLGEGEDA